MRQSCLAAFLLLLATAPACRKTGRVLAKSGAPAAEFVLAAGDSMFWVASDTAGVRLQGAPLDLARVGGRFVEFYVVDDDLSYEGADLVGQSIFRRDLRTGDSVRVFSDSIVPALSRDYGRAHPRDHRLSPDEDVDERPDVRATAQIQLGDAHGPFVSYSMHTDVERRNILWHTSRRGVIDLRNGRVATLADVVGRDAPAIARQAAAHAAHVDPQSFSITTVDGAPAVAFAAPAGGVGDSGLIHSLAPIRIPVPGWWVEVAPSMPTSSADGQRKTWKQDRYSVVVRYAADNAATLFLRDSSSREWNVGAVSSPATRIYWLDRPKIDAETRRALLKAFNEAASYMSGSSIAAAPVPILHLAARHSSPNVRARLNSRNAPVHD